MLAAGDHAATANTAKGAARRRRSSGGVIAASAAAARAAACSSVRGGHSRVLTQPLEHVGEDRTRCRHANERPETPPAPGRVARNPAAGVH
jgi:hypothetical protein